MSVISRRHFLGTGTLVGALGMPGLARAQPAAARFKLGLVTYNLAAGWDLPTTLKVCQAAGIAAVELRTTHKHGVEPSLSKDQRLEVKKRFADSGIVCWGTGSVCEFHSPDPAVVKKNIETCKAFAELTHDIGGKGVKVRPNGLPKDVAVEKTLEQIGKALTECGKAGADSGVEIWVEIHGAGTSDPANVKTFMQHCGHPAVGLTWNSNATDIQSGSVAQAFKLLQPWIKSCHINTLYSDGDGKYPYRELFRLLREANYDRYTLIELAKGMPDVASSEEFLRYYKALWQELTRA